MTKKRVDQLVVEQGLAASREKAQALIMSGRILCGDRVLQKSGEKIVDTSLLRLRGVEPQYVSRGAYKLIRALDHFGLQLSGVIVLDVGASTGGFTQVCLERGALHVFAVDVGSNQLHWQLRSDPRVTSMEQVNFRGAADQIPDALRNLQVSKVDFVCIDTSFISLKLILPQVVLYTRVGATVVALIKPQHEVGRDEVGKGGLVKDPALHERVIKEITSFCGSLKLSVIGVTESPITGTTGNKEFLLCARYQC